MAKDSGLPGLELVQDTHRLLLMNSCSTALNPPLLWAIPSHPVVLIPKVDIILANPPFGAKRVDVFSNG